MRAVEVRRGHLVCNHRDEPAGVPIYRGCLSLTVVRWKFAATFALLPGQTSSNPSLAVAKMLPRGHCCTR